MAFFRQFVAPVLIVLVFLVALLAVGARIFLPQDMADPAPVADLDREEGQTPTDQAPSLN